MTQKTSTDAAAKPLPEPERSRLTREALADVDAARVIDHRAVQAWAEGLSIEPPDPDDHDGP